MATRRAAKKKTKKADAEPKAVGFLGTGKVSAKASKALLTDFVKAQGDVKFVIPITEDYWTNSMTEIATFAEDNDILIEAVWDGEEENDPEEILEGDFEGVKTKKVVDRIIKDSELIIFLFEEGETEELLDQAIEAGVSCYDLGEGLQELELEEVPEDAAESEDEEDDEPEDDDADSDDGDDEEDSDDGEDEDDEDVDLATFDIDSLDVKDDRDRIMEIGEQLGVESYKGMRVGTMVKEIKKAQKVLQATDSDPAPKKDRGSKSAPETGDNEAEVLEAEVLSTTRGGTVVNININVEPDDLTEEFTDLLREFLSAL